MTRTIMKRADELAVGDVLRWGPVEGTAEPRCVVVCVIADQPRGSGHAYLEVADIRTPPRTSRDRMHTVQLAREHQFEVEAPALTPAQEHAELFEKYAREFLRLSQNSGPAGFANVSEFKALRDALDKIRPPEPPTLAEALEALSVLYEGTKAVRTGEWDHASMQVARNQAHSIVERARRAGILP
jgi:hypothetical protein